MREKKLLANMRLREEKDRLSEQVERYAVMCDGLMDLVGADRIARMNPEERQFWGACCFWRRWRNDQGAEVALPAQKGDSTHA